MRYLRRYNEEIESDPEFFLKLQKDFKLFASECLIYLIDDGFTISIEIVGKPDFVLLNNNTTTFTWSDIKDDFIPFIELTKEKFEIFNQFSLPFYIITTEGNYQKTLDDILSDDMSIINDRKIKGIQFKIKDYKQ